jgi:RND family efflux transporter MFP subunit
MNRLNILIGVAAAGLLLAGCNARPAKPKLGEVERLPSLETVYPKYTSEKITVDLLATVEPFEKADLCSQVQGEVKNLGPDIDIDRRIFKGQPLLTLDIPAITAELHSKETMVVQANNLRTQAGKALEVAGREVREAEARLKRSEADLEYRSLQVNRVRKLAARDTVSQQLREEAELQLAATESALDEAKALVATKNARLESARAEVAVAQSKIKVAEAERDLQQKKVNFATIRAPFDGVITRRWVDNGAVIKDPGAPLLTVMRTDIVRVLVDVPERYVPLIRASEGSSARGPGNEVQLHITSLSKEWKPPAGVIPRITRIGPALDPVTRLLRAEIHVKNLDGQLRPGMTGRATVVLEDGRKRLTIPSTALVRVGKEIRVYYIADPHGNPLQGEVKATVVSLGLDNGKTVEVKSGLSSNELVIAKGNGVLAQGTAIAVKLRETKH